MEMTEKTKAMIHAELDSLKSRVDAGLISRFSYNNDRVYASDGTTMTCTVITCVEEPQVDPIAACDNFEPLKPNEGRLHFTFVNHNGKRVTETITTKHEFVEEKFQECLSSLLESTKDYRVSVPIGNTGMVMTRVPELDRVPETETDDTPSNDPREAFF